MKDDRFIELLNLFVDQQLTAAEAAELEQEIRRSPVRMKRYQQYCRMQKACTLLFDQERRLAPSSTRLARAIADADRKIQGTSEREVSWWQRGVYISGIAAVAACAAFVFVRPPSHPSAASQSATSVSAVAAKAEPAAVAQLVAIPPADRQVPAEKKANYSLLPVKQLVPTTVLVAHRGSVGPEEKPDFGWLRKVEMSPLSSMTAEDLLAGSENDRASLSSRYLTPVRSLQGNIENAAFQYQK